MKALDKSITCQIRWMVNGRDLKDKEYVSTSYMNRGQKRNLDNPDFHKYSLEIQMSPALFLQIFSHAYDPFIIEEQKEEPYEWGQFEVFDKLRRLSYPTLESLYQNHQDLMAETLLELEIDFSDLIAQERDPTSEISIYLHAWQNCLFVNGKVIIQGLALSSQSLE